MRRCFPHFALTLLLVAGACPAEQQEELLQRLAERLSEVQELSGEFQQEKHVSFLQNPFVSSGSFSISRINGLSWHVTDPLDSLMRVQGETVTLDGKTVNDFGVAQLITRLMFAFMEGDLSGLLQTFEVDGAVEDGSWQVTLIPNSSRLKAAFDRIDMRGDEHLREVIVFEAEGNRTMVRFTDVQGRSPAAARSGAVEPDGS